MKVLLTMNLPYLRSYGGTNRSNRSLAESLAARGHELFVVVPALATPSSITYEEFLSDLRERNIAYVSRAEHDAFRVGGVEIIAVRDPSRLRASLVDAIKNYEPDWILVSSEDQSQNLLGAALSIRPKTVVYLAHTPQMFPFGPASLYPGEARTQLVKQSAGIVAISRFVASYITQWTGCEVFVNHPPHYGTPPFEDYGSLENGYVALINACAVKGMSILTSLAAVLPHIQFAAVPGWGTTQADIGEIAKFPNITLLKNSKNLDEILQQTRLLLMPSLWIEGFGMSVVDAMLRGIPVLASNLGGLPEAKLGTEFVFDVAPITRFRQSLDDALLPLPIVPLQDIHPWRKPIEMLLSDRPLYRAHSLMAREVSNKFVATLSCGPLEKFLLELSDGRNARNGRVSAYKDKSRPADEESPDQLIAKRIRQLTPEQRALLVLRRTRRRMSQQRKDEKISVIRPV
jgi:glycosyltransferase involved in cell wall biosynthesis